MEIHYSLESIEMFRNLSLIFILNHTGFGKLFKTHYRSNNYLSSSSVRLSNLTRGQTLLISVNNDNRSLTHIKHASLWNRARVVEGATASTYHLLVLILFGTAEIETVKCDCHCNWMC